MKLNTIFYSALLSMMISLNSTDALAGSTDQFETELAQHKGKVVYIDFWASWCVPCRQSFPWLNAMKAKYKSDVFTILSVNVDSQRSFAEQFLLENKADFPVFYDPKGDIAKAFKLRGMPSSFLVDKTGEIVSAHVGFNDQKKLIYQQEIDDLLTSVN